MTTHRQDFAVLRNNPDMTYLDCAATTFMPDSVVKAWVKFQEECGVSLNRGGGFLSCRATEAFEGASSRILSYFGCGEEYEIAYTKNATESSNLFASVVEERIGAGDVILVSPYEHHSNILPWKRVAERRGASIVEMAAKEDGSLDYDFLYGIDPRRIKVITVSLVSNVTSYRVDAEKVKRLASDSGALLVYDVSQAAGHLAMDFRAMGADAYFMSAHKMYGPKNVGAIVIRKDLCDELPPFLLGGGMVWDSQTGNPKWLGGGRKYLAGTFDIGLVSAWAESCRYIEGIGKAQIECFEREVYQHAKARLSGIPAVECVKDGGCSSCSLLSFVVDGVHPHDLEQMLAGRKVVLRTGHLCAQDALRNLGYESVLRISWGIGSSCSDVDRVAEIIEGAI